MNTVTLSQKEYLKIIKTQEQLSRGLSMLQKKFKEFVSEFKNTVSEEVRSEYIKKLDRIDADIDKGKCTRFSNVSEMKKYLRDL